MSKPIIEVKNLSKVYNIGHEQKSAPGTLTFRDSLTQTLRKPLEIFTGHRIEQEKFWALKDVNFEVNQGDVVGIIGRNGSGKSTLLKVLSRIVEPTQGEITMRGRVASLLEVGTGFHPELTGRENVYFNGAILGMSQKEIKSKFDEIVAFSEVEKFLDTPVKFYSSGMYVRLAFAVAAHLDPDILIVDEVLAVGDAAFQKKCLGKMKDVAGQGRTVLFVSHSSSSVAALCNRAILMGQGRILSEGSTRDVLDKYLGEEVVKNSRVKFSPNLGNDVVKLISAEVITTDRGGGASFRLDDEIVVSFQIDVCGAKVPITPNIHLKNTEGDTIFVSSDQTSNTRGDFVHEKGIYVKRCVVPANLLSPGTYFISLAVSTMSPVTKGHFFAEDALAFNVADSTRTNTTTARGSYQGELPGIIRPLLEWESRKVNKGDKE